MRGFVSFIIVFISIAIILVILSTSSAVNLSQSIELERMHNFELDIKNSLLDLAKQGADRAIKDYVKEKLAEAATGVPPYFDPQEMKNRARLAAHEEMKKILLVSDDNIFRTRVWCGFASNTELRDLSEKILKDKNPLVCENCFDIKDCADFVQIKLEWQDISHPRVNVSFWKAQDLDKKGVVGLSIYSKKFDIAAVSYIPENEER